jgi:hypothetical protein
LKTKSLATLQKTQTEIEEFERFVKSDGYPSRADFWKRAYENYVTQKRAGIKLFYPARFLTDKEERLLRKLLSKKPAKGTKTARRPSK